jgi:hypothetical protein
MVRVFAGENSEEVTLGMSLRVSPGPYGTRKTLTWLGLKAGLRTWLGVRDDFRRWLVCAA